MVNITSFLLRKTGREIRILNKKSILLNLFLIVLHVCTVCTVHVMFLFVLHVCTAHVRFLDSIGEKPLCGNT